LWKKYEPNKLLIEDKSSGASLIQELRSEGVFRIEPYVPLPGSDKFLRTAAQSIKFENGRIHLPKQAPWLDDYVRELTGFPGGKYDDQVDSTTQALESLLVSTVRALCQRNPVLFSKRSILALEMGAPFSAAIRCKSTRRQLVRFIPNSAGGRCSSATNTALQSSSVSSGDNRLGL